MDVEGGDNNSLLEQVEMYRAYFPEECEKCEGLVKWLAREQQPLSRSTFPAHITASGIVLSADRVLLIYHPILCRWLQPGGHVEPKEQPLAAAIREVEEETGRICLANSWHRVNPIPFDIDVHPIPANPKKSEPSHFHCDFRYLLYENSLGIESICSHKSRWIKFRGENNCQLTAVDAVLLKAEKITGLSK